MIVTLGPANCTTCGRMLLGRVFVSAWGKPFCDRHASLPRCRGCQLPLEPPPRERLPLCADCRPVAVGTQGEVKHVLPPLAQEIRALGVRLRSRTHVRLVDPSELPSTHPGQAGEVAGLTLLSGTSAVEIRVLRGLTPARFGSVVAHETMHAYLFERGFPCTHPPSEEGMCELLAHEWVRRRKGPLFRWEQDRLEQNPDPVYGNGFRAARSSVERQGIVETLRTLRRTGRLPVAPDP